MEQRRGDCVGSHKFERTDKPETSILQEHRPGSLDRKITYVISFQIVKAARLADVLRERASSRPTHPGRSE
jgi:hypothetical protein